jgi:hypothetical protein
MKVLEVQIEKSENKKFRRVFVTNNQSNTAPQNQSRVQL